MYKQLIFQMERESVEKNYLPELEFEEQPLQELLPESMRRSDAPDLPEVAENEVVRHFVNISNLNHHVDKGFYPLGSCTMKYNPKINEDVTAMPGFAGLHPMQPEKSVQGALQIMYELQEILKEISGMPGITLQPAAGAHGELTGCMMIRKYHLSRGENRTKMLVPDSAHGTNPASVAIAGMHSVTIKSTTEGLVDLDDLKSKLDDNVAGLMLTNPSTLGIFERQVSEISRLVHQAGGLMYMDGANLNALVGITRPGDMGFDVLHINLHKTFAVPHGGGGPGSGPVTVSGRLLDFLPVPVVGKKGERYFLDDEIPQSIGRMITFYGNFAALLRAYVYIRMHGPEGLKAISKNAIINANYLLKKIGHYLELPYKTRPMHEFVLSGEPLVRSHGVKTMDIAKRLLDYGVHAPTVYFPLVVKEALMIEPTESESRQMLDYFAEVFGKVIEEAESNPAKIKEAPFTTPVRRVDDLRANKEQNVCFGCD
ncbi:MAG: aminomethyl-transferring glycine dehydrogenase subunit GcvPB [Calditrichia bacterium]